VLDAAEALWADEIRARALAERQIVGMRMAQAEEWDPDTLPDVDKAIELFGEWLNGETSAEDLSPEDERRLAVGLGRKR
jgi:hypothetical protein